VFGDVVAYMGQLLTQRKVLETIITFSILSNCCALSGVYTGEKTLNVVAWRFEKMGKFLLKSHRSVKSLDPHHLCEQTFIDPLG
jgi:hypothetical protein